MDLFEGLQKLGLSEKETRVYLALLALKEPGVGAVSKRTGIHRRSCYDALNSLQEKGLASFSVLEGIKSFRATGLGSFKALIKEKEELVESLLPELKKKKREEELTIEIFKGLKSTKGVFEGFLREKTKIYIYGGNNPARVYLKYYYPKFTKAREKLGIKVEALHPDVPGVREMAKTMPLWNAKFIDKKLFSPNFWIIQGDKVFILFWRESPIVIRIMDKALAKIYLGAFRMLWKAAKK
ncbi:MAG: hypothetical protein JW744_04255 [Candidatus Diapherotrites archaeon]|uniref:Transcription regulator TrmB N-terminal domain-containing protein n=1 Tax=Candidatus Iainarchaeum sp. TaxID=3101447 RepID=A0A939C6N9_9ARCH|nr:hypothetical protein [Candidatus Diapherotrites archaeon]